MFDRAKINEICPNPARPRAVFNFYKICRYFLTNIILIVVKIILKEDCIDIYCIFTAKDERIITSKINLRRSAFGIEIPHFFLT